MKQAIVDAWNRVFAVARQIEEISEAQLDDPDQLKVLLQTHFAREWEELPLADLEYGEQIGYLFEKIAEEHLIQPTFITQFPTAISPLARRNAMHPEYTDRFEMYIYGRELGNAFSELNDPIDQRQRFERQLEKKAAGAEETMDYDEDFVTALEHGMPPAAGEGIGIDRLCMFLCDVPSLRDVIFFPILKN
jgi:lysyl-tRNA synthetase class 2